MVNWLQTLDASVLEQATPSSFNTIKNTLLHILRTQRFWHLFIMEQDWSILSTIPRPDTIPQLLDEVVSVSQQMQADFEALGEADLLKTLHLNMPWAANSCSRYEYIVHIINHGTFHRGQIVTMAHCLDMNSQIPATDYNIFNTL